MSARFQFVRYPLGAVERDEDGDLRAFVNLSTLGRLGLWHFEGSMRAVYRWRLVLGPFEVRRWETDREAGLAAAKAGR